MLLAVPLSWCGVCSGCGEFAPRTHQRCQFRCLAGLVQCSFQSCVVDWLCRGVVERARGALAPTGMVPVNSEGEAIVRD